MRKMRRRNERGAGAVVDRNPDPFYTFIMW